MPLVPVNARNCPGILSGGVCICAEFTVSDSFIDSLGLFTTCVYCNNDFLSTKQNSSSVCGNCLNL